MGDKNNEVRTRCGSGTRVYGLGHQGSHPSILRNRLLPVPAPLWSIVPGPFAANLRGLTTESRTTAETLSTSDSFPLPTLKGSVLLSPVAVLPCRNPFITCGPLRAHRSEKKKEKRQLTDTTSPENHRKSAQSTKQDTYTLPPVCKVPNARPFCGSSFLLVESPLCLSGGAPPSFLCPHDPRSRPIDHPGSRHISPRPPSSKGFFLAFVFWPPSTPCP
ncbi:hypothetical protein LZ30DRAFT_25441 [Colletotrichum cereale]|nr:hypothetical protein LZ30DRAFT_25441 [Colletotrichum cereale]